jgi:hypothetical protein
LSGYHLRRARVYRGFGRRQGLAYVHEHRGDLHLVEDLLLIEVVVEEHADQLNHLGAGFESVRKPTRK